MNKDGLVKGTFILTIAIMMSKLMGFIYVIPFTALVGIQGFVLFEYAYKPYAVILQLATMGIPLAVSKYVSKYNELGDYKTGYRLMKTGFVLLAIMGAFAGTLLYFLAPVIAGIVIDPNDQTGNSTEDVIFVIRMLSLALFIAPPLGIIRGFFQGNRFMSPTGNSQVIEQMVRVVIIIFGSYLLVSVWNKSASFAVGMVTLGTSVGALSALGVLLYYVRKRRDLFDRAKTQQIENTPRIRHIYKEVIMYAIPFAIVSLANPLYQLIDTFTINQAMMAAGSTQQEAETVNSIIGLVQRVVFIPVALATAFAYTLVPHITASHTAKNYDLLRGQMTRTFHTIWLLTLPAVMGLFVTGDAAFKSMFGMEFSGIGGSLLTMYAPSGILFALFIITTAMMEGMDQNRFAVLSMSVGVAIKLAINYYMVKEFGGFGSIMATNIGFTVSIGLNLFFIKRETRYSLRTLAKELMPITLIVAAMGLAVYAVDVTGKNTIQGIVASPYWAEVIRMAVSVLAGVLVYGLMIIRNRAFQSIFGAKLPARLRLKK